ncbi:nitrate reductase molybdenum cofactor assembly chaperone [Schaalia sp. ZJ1691]|uniref:nitrate reductase molybdenum cofactor assembly chaperone n=1 Tax=Schaalia sp. ZJ1691 TaxID=2709404 RepID=UPI0013EC9ED5|nr:nitrate reductase molybdenum cofactor assembly chaperone [Schaalia sp. ZJ1691]
MSTHSTFIGIPRIPTKGGQECSREDRQSIQMACSILLDYPNERCLEALAPIRTEVAKMESPAGDLVARFCDAFEAMGLRSAQEHYVETFDQRRRCSLYLSYYSQGDTRGRGQAILAFREIMSQCGFTQERDELPDFLPVCLEFAACEPSGVGEELLAAHREGIEVIVTALKMAQSPYALLLEALILTMPQPSAETIEAVRRLISQGPPSELVGLTASGPGASIDDPMNVQPVKVKEA